MFVIKGLFQYFDLIPVLPGVTDPLPPPTFPVPPAAAKLKPFINLLSFCRFFFPAAPKHLESFLILNIQQGTPYNCFCL